jgi:hypothetical protein
MVEQIHRRYSKNKNIPPFWGISDTWCTQKRDIDA